MGDFLGPIEPTGADLLAATRLALSWRLWDAATAVEAAAREPAVPGETPAKTVELFADDRAEPTPPDSV